MGDVERDGKAAGSDQKSMAPLGSQGSWDTITLQPNGR